MTLASRAMAVLAWGLLAYIAFVTLSPIRLRPQTGHVLLERFLAYLALGAAFAGGYPRRPAAVVGIVTAAALGLEAGQTLVAGRHGEVPDAVEKLLGGLSGIALARLALGVVAAVDRRRQSQPSDDSRS